MPDDQTFAPIARSPIGDRTGLSGEMVSLAERPFLGKLILRGTPEDRDFLKAARKACGVDLPVEPNTVAEKDGRRILWLGPTEWLVRTEPGGETGLLNDLTKTFAGTPSGIVDVSDYYTVFRLAGPRARDVMAKGCPLDLHPRAFAADRCAQSVLAKADILIDAVRVDDHPLFDLQVRWSMAIYLWDWLVSAGREYRSS